MTGEGLLLKNLLLFGRVLHNNGLDVNTRQMMVLLHALDHVSISNRSDFYHACRSILVHHRQDISVFDRIFEEFWRHPEKRAISLNLPDSQPETKANLLRKDQSGLKIREPALDHSDDQNATTRLDTTRTYSSREILRQKDFAILNPEELVEVKRMIRELVLSVGRRRSRRWHLKGRRKEELRRTLRKNIQFGGDIIEWVRMDPKWKPRPIIILADISGSMQRYSEILLYFLYSLSASVKSLEAFVFGTRLTRITPDLNSNNVQNSLDKISRGVPDWSGGTRIGAALRTFNYKWGRRVLNRGAVVMLISDGWDRGEPALLAGEMARLQRTCHRLIWLNPLLGISDYKPLTRGIQAALPYIDEHLPVHNFQSLETLTSRLREIPTKRSIRRQQHLIHMPLQSI
jgi:uncharacterized protein with von Willebrand factor type A (vWA) domain